MSFDFICKLQTIDCLYLWRIVWTRYGACLKLDVTKAYKRLIDRQQLEYTAQSLIVKKTGGTPPARPKTSPAITELELTVGFNYG